MTLPIVTDASFEAEVIGSDKPVLIDFFADWCAPCRQLTPIVEELAEELAGKLKVVKVDVDRSPAVAMNFRVQSIPTLAVIHDRQIVAQQSGVLPKDMILEMVKPVLPADADVLKPAELAAQLNANRVLAVDIRDERSFSRARIPGAVHIPADDLVARKTDLMPTDGRIRVLYGRGSDQAKERADELGEQAVRVAYLEGGFLHWEADGLPVERPD